MSKILRVPFVIILLACCGQPVVRAQEPAGDASALEVFEQRIMPIFRSPRPSSCVQCHLSSVDLKQYILPSHQKTFLSLRDQKLIDLDDPAKSKILTLIRMGEKDADEGARLIHERTRQAEFEAFAAWIRACCDDPDLRNMPPLDTSERAGPSEPDPVIRHTRKSRAIDSFARNIWSQRMRCFPCHTPHEIDPTNPRHRQPAERHKELQQQYGDRINIFRRSPAETLQYLIESSRNTPEGRLPLINLQQPGNSLLVLKPTSKLPPKGPDGQFEAPSYTAPVSHMGGLKMHVDDQSYKAFIAWMQDYARVVDGEYRSVQDLPADDWYPTQYVVRLRAAPEDWAEGAGVQLFVYAWDEAGGDWEQQPIAFTQGTVTPRRMVNGALFLLGDGRPQRRRLWDRQGASLPAGKYLVKTYVDSSQQLRSNPAVLLGDEDFQGAVEIQAAWQEGFRDAEVIAGDELQ